MEKGEIAEVRQVLQKRDAGDPLTAEDEALLERFRADCAERSRQLDAERAELRVGDSARARFYRLKDEKLTSFGPVLEALKTYQSKKIKAPEDRPVHDEGAESIFLGYSLLRWVMKALEDDENDEEAFEISRQCFDTMAPIVVAFVPRWI